MTDALLARREEQARLVECARLYVAALAARIPVLTAAIAGSVARGDFSVWSDVDVVIVADGLPARVPDRAALLLAGAPGGVQPVGFTPDELAGAWAKGNRLVREAAVLVGEEVFRALHDLP